MPASAVVSKSTPMMPMAITGNATRWRCGCGYGIVDGWSDDALVAVIAIKVATRATRATRMVVMARLEWRGNGCWVRMDERTMTMGVEEVVVVVMERIEKIVVGMQ